MPFSRRAEAEADLIGLKLMALAGYNAEKAPETFRRLGAMEVGGKMANMAGSNTARMVLQARAAAPGILNLNMDPCPGQTARCAWACMTMCALKSVRCHLRAYDCLAQQLQ